MDATGYSEAKINYFKDRKEIKVVTKVGRNNFYSNQAYDYLIAKEKYEREKENLYELETILKETGIAEWRVYKCLNLKEISPPIKIGRRKYYTQEQYNYFLLLEKKIEEESYDLYDINEVVKATGMNAKAIKYCVQIGLVEISKKSVNKIYYSIETIERLKQIEIERSIKQSLYSTKKIAEIMNVEVKIIRSFLLRKKSFTSIKIGVSNYYTKNSAEKIIEEINNEPNVKNLFTMKQLAEKSKFSLSDLGYMYRSKKIVPVVLICGKNYFSKETLHYLIKKFANRPSNNMLTTKEVQQILGFSPQKIRKLIQLSDFKTFKHNRCNYYSKETIEVLKEVELKYIKISQINYESNVNRGVIKFLIETGEFGTRTLIENNICFNREIVVQSIAVVKINIQILLSQGYYILGECSEIIGVSEKRILELIKVKRIFDGLQLKSIYNTYFIPSINFGKLKNMLRPICEKTEIEIFNEYKISFNQNLPKTNDFIGKYLLYILKKNNGVKNRSANKIGEVCILLGELLVNKEIFELSDLDVEKLLSNNLLNNMQTEEIVKILRYAKINSNINCAFEKQPTYIKTDIISQEKKIYSYDEWINMHNHLIDVDEHFDNAVKDRKYAMIWTFALLHQYIGWRSMDFSKIPSPDLYLVGIYNYDWFETNTFRFSHAEKIIKDIREKCENIYASKNKKRLHFAINQEDSVPISIAIIILEIHRIREKDKVLIRKDICHSYISSNQIKKIMAGIKSCNIVFQSRMANRTLESYIHKFASLNTGYSAIAYKLVSYSRSHTVDQNGNAEVSKVYILDSVNNDGSIAKVSYSLCIRGFWGWLYQDIIRICFSKEVIAGISLDEETQLISGMRQGFLPQELEQLSNFMLERIDGRNEVIKELLLMEKHELDNLIHDILNKKLPGKSEGAYCIKYGNCIYPLRTTCIGCNYAIMEYYTLYSINDALLKNLQYLKELSPEADFERIKSSRDTIMLFDLVRAFKSQYDEIDKEYIGNFISIETIKEDIKEIFNNRRL